MSNKILNLEKTKFKLKNINKKQLSNLLNQTQIIKKLKNKNIHQNNDNSNIFSNSSINITYNKYPIKKSKAFGNLTLDIEFPENQIKPKIEKKQRIKYNYSNKIIYPKKLLNFMNLNQERKLKIRRHSFNKSQKEKIFLFQKILYIASHGINPINGKIPQMTLDKTKRKKNLDQSENFLVEKSINQNLKDINKYISKPQYLYKGPFKGENTEVKFDEKPSLFRKFISRNLKTSKNDNINEYFNEFNENTNKGTQAVSFQIKYDNNGTAVTKRIFNSTFRLDNDSVTKSRNNKKKNEDNKKLLNEESKNSNSKKKSIRTFGGIMWSKQN